MTRSPRIAVVGAGLIGRRHAALIAACPVTEPGPIVDPDPAAADLARERGVPHFADIETAIAAGGIDGVVLATPNRLHEAGALAAVAAGLPVLIEKPIAANVSGAARIAEAAARAAVPVLVGHHRRHNPIVAQARALIEDGRLGRIVALHCTTWFRKPDDYFDVPWRRVHGGGPIYINLIHDIDLLQHFAGPIAEVHAFEASAARGFEVEDSAAASLRFASGALGTVTLSDAVAAPWSWELTSGENPSYPATSESAYLIGGSRASLSLPDLRLWTHEGEPSWWSPITHVRKQVAAADPLMRQIAHFAAVIRGEEEPRVTAADGLAALAVIEAIKRSAETGAIVRPADLARR